MEGPCLGGSSDIQPLLVVQTALDGALLLLIIGANSFVLLCVWASQGPARCLPGSAVGRASRRLIASLAAADALVGVSTIYFFSFRYSCDVRCVLGSRRWPCLTRFFLIANSHLLSAYCMAAIAIDRYVAVVHALRYAEIMSHRRTCLMITAAWLLPLCTSSIVLAWNNWTPDGPCDLETVLPFPFVGGLGTLTHGTLLLVVGVTHYRIHRVVAEVRRESARRTPRPSPNPSVAPSASSTLSVTQPLPLIPRHLPNTKSARTVLLVTGCYFLCWGPYFVLYLIRAFHVTGDTMDTAFNLAHTFANINYLVNPFTYAWKNTEVRQAILKMCKRLTPLKKPANLSNNAETSIRLSHYT